MKKTAIFALSALVMLTISSCNSGSFKRTKNGLMFKVISDGKNPVVKNGQILKFEFAQKLRDSVLSSSSEGIPAYVPIDSSSAGQADYFNTSSIFSKLRKGDSAVIIYEADSIRKKQGSLPEFLKTKDKIFLTVKVVDVFNTQAEADKDREVAIAAAEVKQKALNETQKQKDIATLREYLKSKGINATQAPNGTFVEIVEPGTGPAVDSGKFVTVQYHGVTMAGKVFDSSKDPKFGHVGQGYTFQIGAHGAIEGWDDGLRLFKQGGKGRLFVPSTLAYGKTGAGEDIKPNENLIFDVEVEAVSDTRPAPKAVAPPAVDTTAAPRKK